MVQGTQEERSGRRGACSSGFRPATASVAARLAALLALALVTTAPAAAQAPLALNALLPTAHAARLLDPARLLNALAAEAAWDGAVRGDSVVPDTTDWHAYFPLALGNAWQYRVYTYDEWGQQGGFYYSHEVIGDTLLEGETYAVLRFCLGAITEDGMVVPSCLGREYVRYDEANRMLLERSLFGDDTPNVEWWGNVPCGLDAGFGEAFLCTGPGASGMGYETSGGYGFDLLLPPDTVRNVAYKRFDGFSTEALTDMAAGIGPVYYTSEASADFDLLVWARVGGEEIGTAAFAFPPLVAAEPEPARPGGVLAVFPNPTRGRVRIEAVGGGAGALTVEVYDVLGRRVATRTSDGGAGALTLDLSAVGASRGVYVLRVTRADGAVVGTRRVVVE